MDPTQSHTINQASLNKLHRFPCCRMTVLNCLKFVSFGFLSVAFTYTPVISDWTEWADESQPSSLLLPHETRVQVTGVSQNETSKPSCTVTMLQCVICPLVCFSPLLYFICAVIVCGNLNIYFYTLQCGGSSSLWHKQWRAEGLIWHLITSESSHTWRGNQVSRFVTFYSFSWFWFQYCE